MVDLDYIREHRSSYEDSVRARNIDPADLKLERIFALTDECKKLISQTETLRQERNALSAKVAKLSGTERQSIVLKVRDLKQNLKPLEDKLRAAKGELRELSLRLPNIISPDMPQGKGPEDNKVIKEWGKKPTFTFTPKDHVALGTALDVIDIEQAAAVSGSRFYYLKNELVLMQYALFTHALKKLKLRGFTPIIPPSLVKAPALVGTGYFPFEQKQIFEVNIPTSDDKDGAASLYLSGTSEQAIVAYHTNTTFAVTQLPQKYVGISPCFRTEVGSWGKDVRGIRRVHQFEKVEMILFTTPETSQTLMQEVLSIEEELLRELGLAYRVLDMCTGDVGMPTYRKFDLEVWLPSAGEYMEVMSNSDLDAFHARRLNIRYKTAAGKTDFVHTISATAITNTRPLLAILENYQNEDGSVRVPDILQKFCGFSRIAKK